MTYGPELDYNTADADGGSFDLVPANTVMGRPRAVGVVMIAPDPKLVERSSE